MYEITLPEKLITKSDEGLILRPETASELTEFIRTVKFLKEQEKSLKEQILSEMEENGITSLETDDLKITYVGPGDREVFNKDTFRADHPDLYDKYADYVDTKSYIKIKTK